MAARTILLALLQAAFAVIWIATAALAVMALTGCAGGGSDDAGPEPTPYQIDGTYVGDVDLVRIFDPPNGTAVETHWENVELVADQIGPAVIFVDVVGWATPSGIVFDSVIWRRYPGGTGETANVQSISFYGSLTTEGGELTTLWEAYEDGAAAVPVLSDYTFSGLERVLP